MVTCLLVPIICLLLLHLTFSCVLMNIFGSFYLVFWVQTVLRDHVEDNNYELILE